eukprot:TRINITY_DN9678_c0_g1_i1.p1 TRINITY_DN9678_c0_g1~~TRINITY_DN9678_c0_g1_i1.p1  ORF type:complete len:173 (-),score=29.67 TRINITY_DN9678_c0_g1_i1:25-543(-)
MESQELKNKVLYTLLVRSAELGSYLIHLAGKEAIWEAFKIITEQIIYFFKTKEFAQALAYFVTMIIIHSELLDEQHSPTNIRDTDLLSQFFYRLTIILEERIEQGTKNPINVFVITLLELTSSFGNLHKYAPNRLCGVLYKAKAAHLICHIYDMRSERDRQLNLEFWDTFKT